MYNRDFSLNFLLDLKGRWFNLTHLDDLKNMISKFIKRPLIVYGDP